MNWYLDVPTVHGFCSILFRGEVTVENPLPSSYCALETGYLRVASPVSTPLAIVGSWIVLIACSGVLPPAVGYLWGSPQCSSLLLTN